MCLQVEFLFSMLQAWRQILEKNLERTLLDPFPSKKTQKKHTNKINKIKDKSPHPKRNRVMIFTAAFTTFIIAPIMSQLCTLINDSLIVASSLITHYFQVILSLL